MKKYWKEIVLIIITVAIIIPLTIAFLLSFRFVNTDTTNEWIGFWGGYMGSILGGLITLFVLYATLKENRDLQKRQERIDFCKYIVEEISKFGGKLNEQDIYLLRFIDESQGKEKNKEDIYKALLAYNEATVMSQTISSHLIAKIKDKNYVGAEKLMDGVHELQNEADGLDIKFEYTAEESENLEKKCDNIKRLLGKMRDFLVEFLQNNAN